VPTDPEVLRKIWRHYQGRITLNIYTRNSFHANVYIFDLPFRKSVAFVGSGHLTLEGLKDSEELFYKITDAKEIETLKSWFIGYYEFAEPLNETLIQEYELVYPTFKERENKSRNEKKQLLALTTAGFSWDHIKFKNQYFKKEDYLTLANSKALITTPELLAERVILQTKLLELHEQIKGHVQKLKIDYSDAMVSSLDPTQHTDRQLCSMWLAYGRSAAVLKKYDATLDEVMHLQIIVNQKDLGICLVVGTPGNGKADRSYFSSRMNDAEYRNQFFTKLKALGADYWIEIACERKPIEFFQTEDALWAFTKADQWLYYKFIIGKNYSPDAIEISNENIAPTLTIEFDKLILIYREMKAPDPT
jgi:hypothetical protein